MRFNQIALAIDADLSGQGIALASRSFVEAGLAGGRLVDPFSVTLEDGTGLYVVTPRRHAGPTAAVKAWPLSHRDHRA